MTCKGESQSRAPILSTPGLWPCNRDFLNIGLEGKLAPSGFSTASHQHPLGTRSGEATRQVQKVSWKSFPNGCINWFKQVQTPTYADVPPAPRVAVLQHKVANMGNCPSKCTARNQREKPCSLPRDPHPTKQPSSPGAGIRPSGLSRGDPIGTSCLSPRGSSPQHRLQIQHG